MIHFVTVDYSPMPSATEDCNSVKLNWRVNELLPGIYEVYPPGESCCVGTIRRKGNRFHLNSSLGIDALAPSLKACVLCLARRWFGRPPSPEI